jgi:ADP-heptose:LPS heptosyltransferase
MVAALLKQASMVIGGDTGFIHLAVALGRPVIMVGSRNMVLPLEEHGFAARATTDGVGDVDVEQVVAEVRRRLAEPLGSLGRRSRAELIAGWK